MTGLPPQPGWSANRLHLSTKGGGCRSMQYFICVRGIAQHTSLLVCAMLASWSSSLAFFFLDFFDSGFLDLAVPSSPS